MPRKMNDGTIPALIDEPELRCWFAIAPVGPNKMPCLCRIAVVACSHYYRPRMFYCFFHFKKAINLQ